MKIHLLPPEAHGWRWSVVLECGNCGPRPCNFVGHANGWIEAQEKVKLYLAVSGKCALPFGTRE